MIPGSGVGLDRMFNGSVGMQVNRMLDALGLPDAVGDMIGARIDAQRGDVKGMMRNLQDLTSGLNSSQMDGLFGKGLVPGGFVPRPMSFLAGHGIGTAVGAALGGALGGAIGGAVAGLARPMNFGFNPFGGLSREQPFGTGFVGRSMERAINSNPFFKAQLEAQLGGRIIADGRNDGRLTVWRPPFANVGGIMRDALAGGLLPRVGIGAALAGMAIPMAGALAANAVARGVLGGLQRMEGNISSFMQGVTGPGQNTTVSAGEMRADLVNDPEAAKMAQGMGIDIRNASFEDILFLMLMKYASKKEREIMGKVKALDKSMKAANDAKGQESGGGGLGSVFGAVGNIAGSIFGGPFGGMLGGAVGGIAGNVLGNVFGGGGAEQGGVDAANSETIDGQKIGEMSETLKQQMLQKLMSDLQKMYEMLSNMMKSMHDMQMTPIRNLRG